jgi:multidrug transporter EmrE-like cation transporter
MNALTWFCALSGVALNAAAQLFLKSATNKTGAIDPSWTGLTTALPALLSQGSFWCGLGCYGISIVVWLVALSRAPVSVIYPLLSLGYVVNAMAAALLLGEQLNPARVAGILVIITGVFIVSRTA